MKKVKLLVLCLLVFAFVATTVSVAVLAHSNSQQGSISLITNNAMGHVCHGTEAIGWVADPFAHLNGNYSTFSFSASFPADEKDMIRMGAMGWQSVVNFSEAASGAGLIFGGYDHNSSCIAFADVSQHTSGTNGHITSWKIYFNDLSDATFSVAMHEFGHIIGLCDLYVPSNANKLMYFSDGGSATQVTTMDLWGAKVITGQHSSHTWEYGFYRSYPDGNTHRRYCTRCQSWEYASEQYCTYDANGICTVCGSHR